ncbi:MAG: dCTP deaminase, partial [Nitrosarchaeum sp.]
PLVFPDEQIQNGIIDVRLGNEFIISRRIKFDTIDPILLPTDLEVLIKQYQEKIYVELGDRIILHPQQFLLGSTLEHIKLPNNLLAYVLGRSSWGRLGLVIATATVVNPNYSGAITLELANIGDAPITLYPGIRIAQLVFHTVNPSKIKPKPSKYQTSIGPVFSKIYDDPEWDAFRLMNDKKDSKKTKT